MQRPLKNPYRSSTKYYHVKYLHANISKHNHRGEPCKHVNISQITSRVPDSVLRWLSKTWGTVCKSWRETERKIRSLYSTDFGISWKYFQWKQVRYFSDTDCGRGRLYILKCNPASYDLGPTSHSCKSCMCLQLCLNGFSAGSKNCKSFPALTFNHLSLMLHLWLCTYRGTQEAKTCSYISSDDSEYFWHLS